ncbi:MAG: HpcH/HpaI aldolase family protein [Terriglobia bacterium]
MRKNTTLERIRKGEVVLGCALQYYRSAEIARVFAAAGFDYFFIDAEHGGFDLETIQDMISAAAHSGITPLVRVGELHYSLVARFLDVGAQGIVLPRVESPRLLKEAISWARFPPLGNRGFGVMPPLLDYEQRSFPEIIAHLNANTLIVVQFETRAAMERANELLSIPGVDVAMVGPADLSVSLGIPGEFDHPELVDCILQFMKACNAHSVVPGIHCRDEIRAAEWIQRGMRFVGSGGEHSLLFEKARQTVAQLREQVQSAEA